jgi:chloramphenicol 3-O phosphotransferase
MLDGRVVVLNGPSSAGKTTLAQAMRDAGASRIASISIDTLYPCITATQSDHWDDFKTLTEATFATAAALARGGFDVVVDTVFDRIECLEIAKAMLGKQRFCLVAVTCAPDLLEAREKARGDRLRGLALSQAQRVFHGLKYDLTVDTGMLSVEECVARIAALLLKERRT